MQLAVVVEVVLAVELVLSAELTREAVGAFAMKTVEFGLVTMPEVYARVNPFYGGHYSRLLVTLEVLVASEGLVAAGVVALAHGPPDNVDLSRLGLVGSLP